MHGNLHTWTDLLTIPHPIDTSDDDISLTGAMSYEPSQLSFYQPRPPKLTRSKNTRLTNSNGPLINIGSEVIQMFSHLAELVRLRGNFYSAHLYGDNDCLTNCTSCSTYCLYIYNFNVLYHSLNSLSLYSLYTYIFSNNYNAHTDTQTFILPIIYSPIIINQRSELHSTVQRSDSLYLI